MVSVLLADALACNCEPHLGTGPTMLHLPALISSQLCLYACCPPSAYKSPGTPWDGGQVLFIPVVLGLST